MNDKIKKTFDYLSVTILKILMVVVAIGFFIFWIGGCAGNFLNVDESPFPGLHWKP